MAADLDVLLREVDDVKQQLAEHNGLKVDSNAIFDLLEQNGFRENRIEFVVRQFLGEDELNEVDRLENDSDIEYIAVVNRGDETIDLTVDVADNTPLLDTNGSIDLTVVVADQKTPLIDTRGSIDPIVEVADKNTPLLDTNRSISKGKHATVTDDDSASCFSGKSEEFLTKRGGKRKCNTTAATKKRKKEQNTNFSDSGIQAVSPESSKDASAPNTDHITYSLCDVNNNDPNNNFGPESSLQQAGALTPQQTKGESDFFNLPSTSEANINVPSCSFQSSVITNANFENLAKEDLPSDDISQLNDEVLELSQEDVREMLLREARFIHSLVPHQHLDEIFSYLEANLDSADRMKIVLLDFLQRDKQRGDIDQQKQLPSLPITSTFSENVNSATVSKTDVEPAVPNPIANTYSAEVEICSILDDEQPIIKTKMDTVMNTENVTSSDISVTHVDCAIERQIAKRTNTSTSLNLTNEMLKGAEENEILQKYITTLTEMFPNLPKELLEQQCKKMRLSNTSLETLVLKLLEIDSESEVKEVPPEQNLGISENHSTAGNRSSASINNSHPIAEKTNLKEGEVGEVRYKTLLAIFPDADPDYLREKANSFLQDDENFRNFIVANLEHKGYPSLEDYKQRQERAAIKKKYSEDFSVQAFLEIFPDPLNYFKQRNMFYNTSVREYAINFLKKKFFQLRMETVRGVYNKHGCNLTSAFEELQNMQNNCSKKTKRRKNSRLPQPLVADFVSSNNKFELTFLQEIAYLDHKDEIDAYLKEKAERRQKAFEEAKKNGDLLECVCCYDNEILSEDIRPCEEGHLFCKECVKKSAEIAIGQGKTSFPCLTSCKAEFSLKVLQTVLKPDIFSKMIKRKQLEEVKQAGIEGLETCPFCDFASIPEEENKIFQCLNPECMKESCRACKEPSHIPFRCEEVEKADEVKMRVYIEDRMTQALVRQCWRCKQKFVKEDGCNKMNCHCGAMMCYICRQPVKDYKHFNGQGGTDYHKCPLYSNNDELHITAVEQEGLRAKTEVQHWNPTLKLKHDPTKSFPKTKYKTKDKYDHNFRALFTRLKDDMLIFDAQIHERDRRMQMHLTPDRRENAHAGLGDFVSWRADIAPTPPHTVDRIVVHNARINEMQPVTLNVPINGKRSLFSFRVDDQNQCLPKSRRYSTPPQYQHVPPVMPNVQIRRLAVPNRDIVPLRQAIPAHQNILSGPVKQPLPAYYSISLEDVVKQLMSARHNVQTHGCSIQVPVQQPIPAHNNVHTPRYNLPGPVKQPLPVHQNAQTSGYIQPGPARPPPPNVVNGTFEFIQPDSGNQDVSDMENWYLSQSDIFNTKDDI